MRKLAMVIAAFGGLIIAVPSYAAPAAPEFAEAYSSTFGSCTSPGGSGDACRAAIVSLVDAYIGPDPLVPVVAEEAANTSFSALRDEVFEANAEDPVFQAEIEAIFDELLPNSAAIAAAASPTAP